MTVKELKAWLTKQAIAYATINDCDFEEFDNFEIKHAATEHFERWGDLDVYFDGEFINMGRL